MVSYAMADCVQEVSFSKADTSIEEERVISISERMANGNTTCVGKSVAGTDYKAVEVIIGV